MSIVSRPSQPSSSVAALNTTVFGVWRHLVLAVAVLMIKPVSLAAASRMLSWMPPSSSSSSSFVDEDFGDWRRNAGRRRDHNHGHNDRGSKLSVYSVSRQRKWNGPHDSSDKSRQDGQSGGDDFVEFDGLTVSTCLWGALKKNKLRSRNLAVQPAQMPIEPLSVTVTANQYYGQQDEIALDDEGQLTVQLASPLVPIDAWEKQTGDEFQDPELVEKLAQSGLYMATQQEQNDYVEWKPAKDTKKAIASAPSVAAALDQGEILIYLGKAKSDDPSGENGFQGGDLPLVMTKSILPLSAEDMADLLMDSSRVKTYNKMSLGRTDIRKFSSQTKIVRNITKPPIAKSKMVSVTLMHARPLTEGDKDLLAGHVGLPKSKKGLPPTGYLVVTRAVPGADKDATYKDLTRNDIMLGVNLLQEISPDSCLMTTVTHVYSPSLPKLLAAKVGLNSAINFVNDIRHMCQENLVGAD